LNWPAFGIFEVALRRSGQKRCRPGAAVRPGRADAGRLYCRGGAPTDMTVALSELKANVAVRRLPAVIMSAKRKPARQCTSPLALHDRRRRDLPPWR
jgi:hypothetical protein